MIAALARKEFVQRRVLLGVAFVLVVVVAASMPFWFGFSLKQATSHRADETAALVLANLKSYAFFIESSWLARGLGRTLMLLALIGGAGAIAGEREARTLPMLAQGGMSLPAVAMVKFCATTVWLFLVALASAGVLSAASAVTGQAVPALGIVLGSFVAWANAVAFLAIVFCASALTTRTAVAGVVALALGLAVAGVFAGFGVNATALGAAVTSPDGSIDFVQAVRSVALAVGIATVALAATFTALDLRRA